MTEAPSERPSVPPLLAIAFGILAVSTASIFIRYAQAAAPSLVIAAYRLTLATLLLAPVALTRHRDEIRRFDRRQTGLALLSGLFLAVHFASWITSLEYTSVASSVVLVTTTPLWVGLLAPLVLRERLNRWVVVGLLVTLAGGALIGVSDTCRLAGGRLACPPLADFARGKAFVGDLLALLGAWMAAGYILIGRRLRPTMSLTAYVFTVYGAAALALIAVVGAARLPAFGYPPQTYLWFAALAVVPQLIGHTTFNWALRYLSAAYVSISLMGEPIGSTILAYLLLGEVPAPVKLAGVALILAGIYLASRVASPAVLPD